MTSSACCDDSMTEGFFVKVCLNSKSCICIYIIELKNYIRNYGIGHVKSVQLEQMFLKSF